MNKKNLNKEKETEKRGVTEEVEEKRKRQREGGRPYHGLKRNYGQMTHIFDHCLIAWTGEGLDEGAGGGGWRVCQRPDRESAWRV